MKKLTTTFPGVTLLVSVVFTIFNIIAQKLGALGEGTYEPVTWAGQIAQVLGTFVGTWVTLVIICLIVFAPFWLLRKFKTKVEN